MSKSRKAVIIIPTYNEVDSIELTLKKLVTEIKKIKGWVCEILVVDDTSPDKTYELVKKLALKNPSIKLLQNKIKAGLGGAYLKGMAYSFDLLKADVVFEFDADLSHPPDKISLFLEKIDAGYSMVVGNRYSSGGSIPANWGWHRKFLSIVGNWIIMIVFLNFTIRDWTSGFRAITKPVYESIHPLLHSAQFYGYTFQIGFLYYAVKKDFKIEQVPYHFSDRLYGKSKIGPEYIKNTLFFIFKIRIEEILKNRIFKFSVVGAIGAVVQFISLALLRGIMSFTLAYFLAAQLAVTSNFVFSNLWTFNDRKLKIAELPLKYLAFSIASFGSVAIQTVLAFLGSHFIGDDIRLFDIPFSQLFFSKPFVFDTGYLFMFVGILVGMVWNYTAYSRIIWKNKQ